MSVHSSNRSKYMKSRESVAQAFGEEKVALYEVEIQQLVESNYLEKALSPVYDHGKTSQAIMLVFTRK
jgi:hypothetical protein